MEFFADYLQMQCHSDIAVRLQPAPNLCDSIPPRRRKKKVLPQPDFSKLCYSLILVRFVFCPLLCQNNIHVTESCGQRIPFPLKSNNYLPFLVVVTVIAI